MKWLWKYWKLLIDQSNKDKITDKELSLFLPVSTYWFNSIWRTSFVIVPNWKL